jgi:peptide/nickel transport system permease protein
MSAVQTPGGEHFVAEVFETAGLEAGGNWTLMWRRLRRNRAALIAGAIFLLIVLVCYVGAPAWADWVAHRGPSAQNIQGTITSGGKKVPVVGLDGTPIGPGLRAKYLLGADSNGRDLFVRVLYGGRTSLTVGILSAILCTLVALLLALPAGYYGGRVDRFVTRLLDLIWSFPVYLLAVALAAVLVVGGLDLGPVHIGSDSLAIPIFVIALVFIPYIARPVRGEVLTLRRREFVEAAIAHGASPLRVMFREILPNVMATTLVLFTLIVANNILVEAALSYLGVGVSVLTPSWGNIIEQGSSSIVTAPWQTIVPGLAIMFTAISLNVFGDGLRDALDPHGEQRGGGGS